VQFREVRMRRFGATVVLLLSAMPTLAAELPTRKAGLWEIRMNDAPAAIQQCIDAATDKTMGAKVEQACPKREVQRSGDTWTVESTCTFGDKTVKSHTVAKGSFDSGFTQTMTSEGDASIIPGGKVTIKTDAKWLGPCAADQKPGDTILGNGIKVNGLDMNNLHQGAPK
jgi:hypothetical protein